MLGELSDLTVMVIKFGFLAVLWLFVLTALSVMRRDLFGPRAASRVPPAAAPQRAGAAPHTSWNDGGAAKASRGRRRGPGKLVVTAGGLAGTTIPLADAPVTLGRAQDSTLVLTDDYASNRHARFFAQDGQWYVEDLGSTNGTYLDRTKVTGPTSVPQGVPVRIGKTVVELRK